MIVGGRASGLVRQAAKNEHGLQIYDIVSPYSGQTEAGWPFIT